ncbi:MAG TPA: lysophospholipid acyltransferase family protein [Terracidiphilus sp.]|nr:lysophospholipid acyltransferase family protein [Terracidiphilus sp.]
MSLRAVRRAVALAFTLAWCVLRFWLAHLGGRMTLEHRALWVRDSCRVIMRSMGIESRVEGHPPARGLVVANHLSYLDIVILSAEMPCFFVAKAEIDGWPFFGKAARSGGTIFLDRGSHLSATTVVREIARRLPLQVPVLFFPEGTTTDGSQLLRFRSRLFDPATVSGAPITAASIRYVLADGTPERELCWYGDATFLPHLWKVLGAGGFHTEVCFGQPRIYPDRRTAADSTQAEVEAMRNGRAVALA